MNARDDVEMTFNALSRDVYANESFELNLGWIATGLTTYNSASALRCLVTDSLGNIDF